ncbi:hypothetical protein ABDK10_05330 [Staphylococcus aureus]
MSKIKYEVISDFKDGQDKEKIYKVGENFPKPSNKKVSKARIEELSTSENKAGKPLIKEVEQED